MEADRVLGWSPALGALLELHDGNLRVDAGVARRNADFELRWTSVGRGHAHMTVPPPSAAPTLDGARASFVYSDGSTQWYENGPRGVEQGFVVPARPLADHAVEEGEYLWLDIEVAGQLAASLTDGPHDAPADAQVVLRSADGRQAFRYSDLYVTDASGAEVASWLEVRGGHILLVMDDAHARYPLRIDPLIWAVQEKLLASDGSGNDTFGRAVATAGGTTVVGAPGYAEMYYARGAAYVYVRSADAWLFQQKLVGPSTSDAHFGAAVALAADTALVGAPHESFFGAAHVFERDGDVWSLTQELGPTDAVMSSAFGASVSLSGDTAVVGARADDGIEARSGAAYVFVRSGGLWTMEDKLTAPDGQADDLFGDSVAVSGETAIIGARGDDDLGGDAGAAYVFVRQGSAWSLQQKLSAPDGESNDLLGQEASLEGDTALLGAWGDDDLGAQAGAAYVFVRSGSAWTMQQKLAAPDGKAGDAFGHSVSLSGDAALIGAPTGDEFDCGALYLYHRTVGVWSLTQRVTAFDKGANDYFGSSVCLSGDTLVAGATDDDDQGASSGSAYVYVLKKSDGDPCTMGEECHSSYCVDGVCCDGPCGNGATHDCQTCQLAGLEGVCSSLPEGTSCGNGTGECDAAGACEELGGAGGGGRLGRNGHGRIGRSEHRRPGGGRRARRPGGGRRARRPGGAWRVPDRRRRCGQRRTWGARRGKGG